VGNGWDLEHNYPYSEVFCRAIDVLKLEIERDHALLDMGVVNIRTQVEIK
jgi:hypothetical protein